MPISTHRQGCGTQGQRSRAHIQSHLEHQDPGAAASQMNAPFDREIWQDSSRQRGKGKRSEKRDTDSQIPSHSVWCGGTLHLGILLTLDRFLQLQKVLQLVECMQLLHFTGE